MKAIIPIAGKGTRMMPITRVLPKALLPLVDHEGNLKTVLQVILEQVKQAGVDEVAIIVSPGQQDILSKYFDTIRDSSLLPAALHYIEQQTPMGFGDAVYQGRAFIDNQPFLLLLGDHIHIQTQENLNCIQQVVNAFNAHNVKAMVGVHPISEQELHLVGVASGKLINTNTYQCTTFIEKPNKTQAQKYLKTEHLTPNTYLGHCGIYAFDPILFDYLERVITEAKNKNTEAELARAQSLLLEDNPNSYYLHKISGKAYDTGAPNFYAQAFAAYCKNRC